MTAIQLHCDLYVDAGHAVDIEAADAFDATVANFPKCAGSLPHREC